MNIEWNEIWANIAQNWNTLIYLAGIIFAIVFRGKKQLTEDEKLQIEKAKQQAKNKKLEKAYQNGLKKEIEINNKIKERENENSSKNEQE